MILSESRRFIFFAVPKTGTHTIREALRVHLAEGDWEQQLRYGKQLSPLPEIAAVNHGHVSYRQLSGAIGVTALSEFFRFGFVRHPFDRFVSVCAFLARTDPSYDQDPTDWMKRALLRPQFCKRVLVRRSTRYSPTRRGRWHSISWVAMNPCRLTLTPSATASIYPRQRLGTATAPSTMPIKTYWMTS